MFIFFFFLVIRRLRRSTLFPYTTLFRSRDSSVTVGLPCAIQRYVQLTVCASGFVTVAGCQVEPPTVTNRSEEHTSELQSRQYLVCRLLLEKKKRTQT